MNGTDSLWARCHANVFFFLQKNKMRKVRTADTCIAQTKAMPNKWYQAWLEVEAQTLMKKYKKLTLLYVG